jgi:hypothetical protein
MGVKVTDVPEQIVVSDAVMINEGVTMGFIVIAIEFEVAVAGETQVAFDVITQVIMSVLTKVVLV